MPRKTKSNNKKRVNRKSRRTRRVRGGTKRVEEIRVTFMRHHTNPDVGSIISVRKGPTTYKGDYGKGEYIKNFVSTVAKEVEENIAVIMNGEPGVKVKQKVYKQVYKDNDAPDEEGSSEPVKCQSKGT